MTTTIELPAAATAAHFMTIAEVATLLRVSNMTVYRLVHAGELSAARVGRSLRVPEFEVQRYLREAFGQRDAA